MYVCVASPLFSVRSIHSTGTIILSHGVEGRERPCHVMSCGLSVRWVFVSFYVLLENIFTASIFLRNRSLDCRQELARMLQNFCQCKDIWYLAWLFLIENPFWMFLGPPWCSWTVHICWGLMLFASRWKKDSSWSSNFGLHIWFI